MGDTVGLFWFDSFVFVFVFFLFPQKAKQISPSKMYKEVNFGRIFKQVNVVIEVYIIRDISVDTK